MRTTNSSSSSTARNEKNYCERFFLNTLIVSGLAKRGDTPDAQSPCPL